MNRCARPPRRARIATTPSGRPNRAESPAAPGHRAGRGSQHREGQPPGGGVEGCARPPRRARIATAPRRSPGPAGRGAAPGHRAGRGSQPPRAGERRRSQAAAAPGHRAGRGSQPARARRARRASMLRPATAPGEDRNTSPPTTSPEETRAAPGHRAGRGSQRVRRVLATGDATAAPGHRAGRGSQRMRCCSSGRLHSLRLATAPGEDRNATGHFRPVVALAWARPPRRARIATRPYWSSPPTVPATAPGHRAGRGSQLGRRRGEDPVPRLRPATAPGEDRNGVPAGREHGRAQPLRPATAPGEDRNMARRSSGVVAPSCARSPRRARDAGRKRADGDRP